MIMLILSIFFLSWSLSGYLSKPNWFDALCIILHSCVIITILVRSFISK